jgi:hypothetical protein
MTSQEAIDANFAPYPYNFPAIKFVVESVPMSRLNICDSCMDTMEEEGAPEGAEVEIAVAMGADVADHLCDERESQSNLRCACACH